MVCHSHRQNKEGEYLFYQCMETFIFLDSKHVKPKQKCHEVKKIWHHIRANYMGTLSHSRFPNWSSLGQSKNGHKWNNFRSSCLASQCWRNNTWSKIIPVWCITRGGENFRIVAVNNFVLFHGMSRCSCCSYIWMICFRCCADVPVCRWLYFCRLYRYCWS